MFAIPQSAPVSEFARDQAGTLAKLGNGPLMLMQRTTPVAVVISPAEWNEIAFELQMHREMRAYRPAEIALLAEARELSARNDANNSWVDGSVVEERMESLRAMEN